MPHPSHPFTPPYTPLAHVDAALHERGFALLTAEDLGRMVSGDPAGAAGAALSGALSAAEASPNFAHWRTRWDTLPPDPHLKDRGRYRSRLHANFIVDGDRVERVPHRAHWQPLSYNALHGGIERWFEAMPDDWVSEPSWNALLVALAARASALKGAQRWYVEAHPFRIDTRDGIGRPTPEGAHRDGVDLVAVILVDRYRIKGGETRVFDACGPNGLRFTMGEPWSVLLLDDARMIHEATPIQPEDSGSGIGHRDTLVITLRAKGFQDAASED